MESSILRDKIILIVDDFAINTELFSLFFTNAGAVALTASNGRECVEIVTTRHVDMILMDINMPVMNGIEAAKAVRALPRGKAVAIVGISGDGEAEGTEACLPAGMNMVVSKLALDEEKLIEIGQHFFCDPKDSVGERSVSKSHRDEKDATAPDGGAPQAVIDYARALRGFENDEELLVKLIADFNVIIHSQLALMRQALDKSDFECIWRESHGIKGGAANIFALPLSDTAGKVETACKQHAEKHVVSGLLDSLAGAVEAFGSYVKANVAKAH
jgi:two-component system, sensor histidine kinase and response regulator